VRLSVRKDVHVTTPEFRTAGPLGLSTNAAGWLARTVWGQTFPERRAMSSGT
jgi:hypothetical protein